MWVTLFILNFVDLTSSSYRNQETRKVIVVVVGRSLKEGKLEYGQSKNREGRGGRWKGLSKKGRGQEDDESTGQRTVPIKMKGV